MKRTTKLVVALWAMFVAQTAFSQKGNEQQLEKDANALFTKGEYLKAFPMYSQLVSLYPNHPDYNYRFGACAIYSEADKSKAVKFLTIATSKNVEDVMAWYYLGKAYHLNYQFRESIQSYETFLRKADPKIAAKTDAQREIETCIYGSNLLANIKDLTVINKTEADKKDFFRYFNLEAIGGKILTLPDELKTKLDEKATDIGVIHYPGNSTTIYFSSYGKDGKTGKDIYQAQVLPDGKFSQPQLLKGDVNTGYDEDYCFMHSDGKTLYFASKGHNSMGGYDIFKSVYDQQSQTFGPAINLDFAINTPDDDIFFIADSLNQRAYFASGRTSDQTHLHVYNVLVETTPLRMIYLKGDFISEINSEQKKATIKINDQMTGRAITEGSTNQANGSYLVYVPGAGEYSFKVVTENSPTVHEIKVNVPPFDKPVALRQEMRLVSDGGKDKLIVTNYFETPLEEDLASMSAEFLRAKAGLEVNANSATVSASSPKEEVFSLDRTMENAPIAAGFADGTTIQSVISRMEGEAAAIRKFIAESDQKQVNAYAYSQKKQKQADTDLTKAETLRKSTGTYATQEDVNKLRESVVLAARAKDRQRESRASINASESVKQYKESEAQRADKLEEQIAALKKAQSAGSFEDAVAALRVEKQRNTDAKGNQSGTPYDELVAKAKAKEGQQQQAEQKVADLRDEEQDLTADLKNAETRLSAAKKKADKEAAENEVATLRSALDKVRRDIVEQNQKTDKLGEEAKDAFANAEVFLTLSRDTEMGLAASEKISLTEQDRNALQMKLREMDSRVSALEVTDPQMLALITDASMATYVAEAREATPSGSAGSSRVRDASGISSDHDMIMKKVGTQPAMAGTRRMFIANSLAETTKGIRTLEMRRKQGELTAQEAEQLASLATLRAQLHAEMAANGGTTPSLSAEDLRATYLSVSPDFNEQVAAINNSSGNEIERTRKVVDYKEITLEKLKVARANNAQQASVETDANALSAMATRDQQYESAIRQLESNTADVNQYKAAYETENKSIIESDAVYAGKLQEQVSITESYLSALEEIEGEKEKQLDMTTDAQEAAALRIQLEDIREEKLAAETKLDGYNKDLNLTAATADARIDSTDVALNTAVITPAVSTATPTLEDEIQKVEKTWDFNVAPQDTNGDPLKSQAQLDTEKTEKLFKVKEQSESIFAYESGAFEEVVSQHSSPATELKHRDKIQAINDEIFLIEAEIENEKSDSKLRKLDYRAEQLYLRRSLIEIDNATAISIMAQEEYEEELKKATEMSELNREKLDSRVMIRDFVADMQRQAKSNMQEAATLREIAPSKQDDIERADYYREAFAKEAVAIDQLQHIQGINENIDMLLTYDDQQLAQMRVGKSPDADLAAAMLAEKVGTDPVEHAESVNPSEHTTSESSEAGINPATNETDPALIDKKSVTAVMPDPKKTKPTGEIAGGDISTSENAGSTTAANSSSVKPITPNNTSEKSVAENTTGTKPGVEKVTGETGSKTTNPAATSTPGVKPDASTNNTTTSATKNPGTAKPAVEPTNGSVAANNAASSSSETTAEATKPGRRLVVMESYSAYTLEEMEREGYFFRAPEVLEKELFIKLPRGVYSESKPIPKDIPMPDGVYYKVQIGAFRNEIPQNLYDEFAPVHAESMNNGVTRYTAGMFKSFERADVIKQEIRAMGYSDAFVVAFRDGKRIPLYEAMGKTAADFQASVEKEYVYGDKGEAPKAKPASTASTTAKTTSNYYSGYPDAAKATQVEDIKGLFFTVQVGVYSRPAPSKSVFYINPLNTELIDNNRIRYTSGRFKSMADGVDKRAEAKALGIKDAFITAYYNGKRITLTEADRLLKENGPSILATE